MRFVLFFFVPLHFGNFLGKNCMSARKILFVNQEITPYLEASYMSIIGRYLPQSVQERGLDIRTFMPRFGVVNERKHQLHDVIRLSGQNIVINENDHTLVVKVASIQSVRLQTYFVDNDLYFRRKMLMHDKSGKFFSDNDERAIFYARGVIETVKNLGWDPDIIHCNGWISCLIPLFVKKRYADNPLFTNAKIVYSVYNDVFPKRLRPSFPDKLNNMGISPEVAMLYKQSTFESTTKLAIDYSDAVVISHENIDENILSHIESSKKPHFIHKDEQYADDYIALYNSIM